IGHYAAYKHLVSKFGKDSVYIGTSNDTSGNKSPFNFREKKRIATTMFDIPANRFVQIRNPYKPVEILSDYDGQTTQYVAAVGEKDETRLTGKYFKPYKGKAGYGYDEIGYVYAVPAQSNPISGTDVRNNLGGDDEAKAKTFFTKRAYPKFNPEIFKMITDKLKSINEYGAKTLGTGMQGDFGPNPVDDDTKDEGFPGGVFTGLVSPGGYINGAPKPDNVEKLSKKIHKGEKSKSHKQYVYEPVKELYNPVMDIIDEYVRQEIIEEFIRETGIKSIVEKSENPIMGKEINYQKADGTPAKIKVRAALRLAKDHPAHIAADKMIGKKDEPQRKEKPKSPFD
ncbi:hypothetical protein EBR43_14405, partial [bacterium]|nr:hypothetical protein [bacterium]